jgi:hypothetical protein
MCGVHGWHFTVMGVLLDFFPTAWQFSLSVTAMAAQLI